MAKIIASGLGRNLTNTVTGEKMQPDPTERKFVTYLSESGGVHTIIVDVDHPAETAEELLAWFEHTQALVTSAGFDEKGLASRSPEQVINTAHARMGWDHDESLAEPGGGKFSNGKEG